MFKNIDKQFKAFIIIFGLINSIAYLNGNSTALVLTSVVPISIFSLISPALTLSASIVSLPLVRSLGGQIEILISSVVILSVVINLAVKKSKVKLSHIFYVLIAIIFSLISYAIGYQTAITTLIAFMVVVATYVATFIVLKEYGSKHLIYSFVLSALILILIIVYELFSGQFFLLYGRLNFSGSIRSLANITVIPLLVYTYFILEKRELQKINKIRITKIDYFIFFVLLITLFLTVSRGVIFAYFLGVAVLLLKRKKSYMTIGMLLLSVVLVIIFADRLGVIRISRLFEISLNMNNRLEIWRFYINEMFSRGLAGILFGQGPGDIARVATHANFSSAYAHSVILDVLFSYGIAGLIVMLTLIIRIGISVAKNKNRLAGAIFLVTILMYSTHGTATNREFFILLSMANYLSLSKDKPDALLKK